MGIGQLTEAEAGVEVLAVLAGPVGGLADAESLGETLEALVDAVAAATGAEAVLLRVRDGDCLVARLVAAGSPALAAELQAAQVPLELAPKHEGEGLDELTPATRAVAERIGATSALTVPIVVLGTVEGLLELVRAGTPFGAAERVTARIGAGLMATALRLVEAQRGATGREAIVELTGDALAAGADPERVAERVARLAARATGAEDAWLWLMAPAGGALELAAAHGDPRPASAEAAAAMLLEHQATALELTASRLVATFQLGEPPVGALQLRFSPGREPDDGELAEAARFSVRAAHAIRAADRNRALASELVRTRGLLEVLGKAISELSLAHALETAADRTTAILGTDRVAIYLAEDGRLVSGHAAGLPAGHEPVAERLLELALGPARGRGALTVADASAEPELAAGLEPVLEATAIEAAVAVPLVVGGEVIGLLAAYPARSRMPAASEVALLVALAAQLAGAMQNAVLHERATGLAKELETALGAEREKSRQLEAQHRISQSFTQSMSLEATLEAVAVAVTSSLEIDAAAIQLPDARNAELVTMALHVSDARLEEVARTILGRPQPLASGPLRRLLRTRRPLPLTPARAAELGGVYALLAPFLEKGSSALVIPIATPGDVLGTLTIVSFRADRPIDGPTLAAALAITGQAALAIDNARLYQQQKEFADTMQRSLLPRSAPTLPGLDLGAVYESAAHVDVGGDVYDFLTLPDGRLAVVLGDVTGHGVEATADMAMAKYVFRSLARLYPDPADFLGAANDIVTGEIAAGKFITMTELVVDASGDVLACACAGHPAPRIVRPDGSVEALPVRGLALGIADVQVYEGVEAPFAPGSGAVLYTDGVIEARRDGELFGVERPDGVLAAERGRPAEEIAQAVLEACRAFADGDLADDCAVVVVARR
jgi:serine phosphatase RsbU (regulator of sigma subunit)